MVRVLIDAKADIEFTNESEGPMRIRTPMLTANSAEVLDILARAGAQIDRRGTTGISAMGMACSNGKIDRAELMTMLKTLPKPPDATKTVEELVAVLDVDGDGVIDIDEWVTQLERVPLLKKLLDSYVDPATGLIDPNRNPDLPLPAAAPAPAP